MIFIEYTAANMDIYNPAGGVSTMPSPKELKSKSFDPPPPVHARKSPAHTARQREATHAQQKSGKEDKTKADYRCPT
jgi:hypothetical protein